MKQGISAAIGTNAQRLILSVAVVLVALLGIGCKQDYPERHNWALAFKGEYEQLKELYLADVRIGEPDPFDPKEMLKRAQGRSAPRQSWGCVDALAAMGDDTATTTLVEMFDEGKGDFHIVEIVACSAKEEAIAMLLRLAEDKRGEIHYGIALGLTMSECLRTDPRAVEMLCQLLRDKDPVMVSQNAAVALSMTPTSATVLHAKAQDAILNHIQDPENQPAGNLGPHLYQCLEGLEGSDVQDYIRGMIRDGIAAGYGPPLDLLYKLPESEVIGYLEEASNDENKWTRANAAETAAKMATPRAIAIVERLSRDPSVEVRHNIAWGLVKPFEGREAIAVRLSNDPAPEVRAASAFSLVRIQTEASRKAMLRLLQDRRGTASSGAAIVLASKPGFLTAAQLRDPVQRLAQSWNPFAREDAAKIIRCNKVGGTEVLLLKLLQDDSSNVRSEAYKALYSVNPDVLREFVLR